MNSNSSRDLQIRKAIFWLMTLGGIAAMVIGAISLAVMAAAGLCLLIAGVGSLVVGKYLLSYAKAWRELHLDDYGRK